MEKQRRFNGIYLIMVVVLLFSSCKGGQPEITTTPTIAPTVNPTDTPIPPTPTVEPERIVWVSSTDTAETQLLSATVQSLAQNSGIQFESLPSLDSNQINDSIRVAVFHSPNYDISAAAAGHPDTQFIVIGNSGLQPVDNLTVIRSDPQHVLFAGGYLSMLIAYDWRGAGLIASDSGMGENAGWAFKNGGNYFCGRCSPLSPPYVQFPLVVMQPGASPSGVWYAGFEGISENRLNTVFIDGNISDPTVYSQMAGLGMTLLGSGNPPDAVKDSWAATVQSDVAGTLASIWPDIMDGQGAGEVFVEITLTNVNAAIVGDGMVKFFNEMTKDLEMGLISTELQSQ